VLICPKDTLGKHPIFFPINRHKTALYYKVRKIKGCFFSIPGRKIKS